MLNSIRLSPFPLSPILHHLKQLYLSIDEFIEQSIPEEVASELIQIARGTLQFRYQHAWTYLLPALSAVIRFVGPAYPELLREIVQQLVAIYDSSVRGDAAFSFNKETYLQIPIDCYKDIGFLCGSCRC